MKTSKRLQLLVLLLFPICLSVLGQSTDYSKVAFVGKVIDVKRLENGGAQIDTIPNVDESGNLRNHVVYMDMIRTYYSVTCTVEKLFYSHYPKDTIEFLTYTDKSIPNLSYYKHVFCLLKQNDDGKYETFRQYYDAYQTVDGEWVAGFFSGWMLDSDYFSENFKKVVVRKQQYIDMQLFTTNGVNKKGVSLYYNVKGDRAIPKVAIPVDGLMKHFLIKKVF